MRMQIFPSGRRAPRAWLGMAVSIAAVALCLPGCVSRMFYYPDTVERMTAEDAGAREVRFTASDGVPLVGWFVPASTAGAPTVIHFHGNAQNLTAHRSFVTWLTPRGYHLFLFDYRGYGRSGGRPTPRGLERDGAAAIACAVAQPEVDPTRVFLLGQSLGGTVALAGLAGLSNPPPIRAILLDSTFSSYRAIVDDKIREMPVVSGLHRPLSGWLAPGGTSAEDLLQRISTGIPIAFLHGEADSVIPAAHSRHLHDVAPQTNKTLWIAPGLDHTEAILYEAWQDRVDAFFRATLDL
jgi:hypothetical protein